MERIRNSLNRAYAQRAATAAPLRPVPLPGDKDKIVYVHTRRLDVEPDHLRRNRIIHGLSDPTAAFYSVLRTKVAHSMRDNGWQSLAITSPTAGAGKSVTAINLAISLAREVDRSVLLVDLDLRRPRLRGYFTDQHMPGISDFLKGEAEIHRLLVNPGIERLVILPGNEPMRNAAEMLSSPKMADLVDELRGRYPDRLVLFDMPPVLLCDDVLAFSPYFQAALLVVEEGVTSREELQQALGLLDKTHVVGTVVNKSRAPVNDPNLYGYAQYPSGQTQ